MPDEEDDGHSLEGFGVPNITAEVTASQIILVSQWKREEELLAKVRQLSQPRLHTETWEDPDFEDCLKTIYETRSQIQA